MKLQNNICLVTGAASGIGKAIAARFARKGGTVAVADLQIEAARGTVGGQVVARPRPLCSDGCACCPYRAPL